MTLAADIALIAADTQILHDIANNDASATVTTESGAVDTVARAISKIGNGNYRGAWSGPGTAYAINDTVTESAAVHRCITGHTSAAAFVTDAAKWVVQSADPVNVTNAQMADMAQATVKGRASGAGTGKPVDLSQAQLTALITNLSATQLSEPYTVRNRLINGRLEVWQEFTSYASISGATTKRTADMMCFATINSGTWTLSRETDVPTFAQAGTTLLYSMKALVTTNDATVDAADQAQIRVFIEGYDYAQMIGKTQYLKFWAKSNLTGSYGVAFRNDGLDRSYIGMYTINSADTWEEKTIQISTAPSPGGTWNTSNGEGIRVQFCLVAGSNYHGTGETWQNANVLSTSAQANLAATNANYLMLADLRLALGTPGSAIESLGFSESLMRCQRYFQKSYDYAIAPGTNADEGRVDFVSALAAVRHPITYHTPMRIAPNVATWTPAGVADKWRDGSAASDFSTSNSNIGQNACMISGTASAADHNIFGHYRLDARL